MSEKIVTKVLPKLKVTRTSYLAKESFLTALEGKSRKLFSPDSVSLGHTAAANYLRGQENGKSALEIIVSPENTKFLQTLGGTKEENFRQIVFASRAAMEKLLEEVEAKNARWIGVFHQNTAHTHLHILIAEEFVDESGKEKSLKRIPKHLLYKDEEKLSGLDRKFLKAFKEHFISKPKDAPTLLNERSSLPILAEQYKTEALITLMEKAPFSSSVLNQASENGTIVSDENAHPLFLRRNIDGMVTGADWFDEAGSYWRRTGFENGGWFYLGDLKQAESIILVSSPEEAIALHSLHTDRNLESVAILSLEPHKMDEELGDIFIKRQAELFLQNKKLNVVWATNKNQKGFQIQTGLPELKNYTEKKLRFENLASLNFTLYSRNTSWVRQLQVVTDADEIINLINPPEEISRIQIPQDIKFTPLLPQISEPQTLNNLLTFNSEVAQASVQKLTERELTAELRKIPLEAIARTRGFPPKFTKSIIKPFQTAEMKLIGRLLIISEMLIISVGLLNS